ncbi:thioesterase family protein [Auritidibacter ignavus]|uniref:Thioesterase family protein n=1 Tax=Auritidibacter ignavus TaxID=678932 RepID=A0AAJ6DCG7_9MICC|nr:thioesterase family protein [Auritidibacter ignavus]WGH93600.1 thioesterase family protein [Auritidibacter ignavus]
MAEETHSTPHAYFVRSGATEFTEGTRISYFTSTEHATGSWQDDELYMAAVSGLVAAELEAYEPRENFATSRISFDILGKLHAGEVKVTTRNIRPGRTIELVQSTVEAQGRAVLTARTWRLISSDTSRAHRLHDDTLLAPIDQCSPDAGFNKRWAGGLVASIQSRAADDHAPGHGRIWANTEIPMILDEPTSPFVHAIGMIDIANGLAPAVEPYHDEVYFANVDLSIHLMREPSEDWLGMATSVSLGDNGLGVTSTVLSDSKGYLGRAEQSLSVRDMRA